MLKEKQLLHHYINESKRGKMAVSTNRELYRVCLSVRPRELCAEASHRVVTLRFMPCVTVHE